MVTQNTFGVPFLMKKGKESNGAAPPTLYLEHCYLNPIPSNQLVLNPNIEQNDGWE
ncbi:RagB/SusD family nutrient uptake outer membrane protein [Parapedobacter deserti]|uniref:RagB/SusD family nutrient uptake outer membrane protein n=1 Tax=Parapedobacter deserti TaxID=1912957 RepID=A0ABV7JI86_9SPHI